MGRLIVLNAFPFIVLVHMIRRRNKQQVGHKFSEVDLMAWEILTTGVLGYFIILSMYFFSIPVLNYVKPEGRYGIYYVSPEGTTVYLISYISYCLAACGIYLRRKKRWAYFFTIFIVICILFYAFFSVLEIGGIAFVPVIISSYLLYRLTRASFKKEFFAR